MEHQSEVSKFSIPNERFQAIFSINKKTVGEEYLGDIDVTDLVTNKTYNFPLRGEENTFDPKFTNNNEIGDTCVWVEAFGRTFNPRNCKSGEELEEYIDDYKEGISANDFLSTFEDIDLVHQTILKHHRTGQSEAQKLSGIAGVFVANKEIGNMLIKSIEKGLNNQEMASFARDFKPMTKEFHRLLKLTKTKSKELEMER